jgi:hypothetical protein
MPEPAFLALAPVASRDLLNLSVCPLAFNILSIACSVFLFILSISEEYSSNNLKTAFNVAVVFYPLSASIYLLPFSLRLSGLVYLRIWPPFLSAANHSEPKGGYEVFAERNA